MDRIESMRTFLKVAELRSFTQASRALGLPRTNVSAAVSQLEEDLGVRLLHRTTRSVQLSQDGEVFLERARDLISDLDELTTHFHVGGQELSGRIRVDMPTSLARDVIVPHLSEFLAAHPGVDVELSSTERIADLVREGIDCTIRASNRIDQGLIARPLGNYAMANCVSPSYVARFGAPNSLQDLSRHRLVHYVSVFGTSPDGFEYVDQEGATQEVPMEGRITVDNANSYVAACVAGLGIIQVPRVGVKKELLRGELLEVMLDYACAPMPVSFVYVNRRHQPKRVRVFMEWAATLVGPFLQSAVEPIHLAVEGNELGRPLLQRSGCPGW